MIIVLKEYIFELEEIGILQKQGGNALLWKTSDHRWVLCPGALVYYSSKYRKQETRIKIPAHETGKCQGSYITIKAMCMQREVKEKGWVLEITFPNLCPIDVESKWTQHVRCECKLKNLHLTFTKFYATAGSPCKSKGQMSSQRHFRNAAHTVPPVQSNPN